MSEVQEKRGDARHRIPVVIGAPAVSGLPLVPEDVSAGGFCVLSSRKPGAGEIFTCSIQTGEEVFGSCLAEVVWVRARGGTPPLWRMGISVKSLGSDRARLAVRLQELTERLGLAMLPC